MIPSVRQRAGGLWVVPLALLVLVALLGPPVAGGDGSGAAAAAVPAQDDGTDGRDGPPDVLPPDGNWTVTLVTGEVVDVSSDADGRVSAIVREHEGGFRTLRQPDGRLYVIPYGVTGQLDILDLELFNVTGLIEQGYDDESTDSIGLIVRREADGDLPGTFDVAEDEQPLPSIDAVALELPKSEAAATGEELGSAGADEGADPLADVTRVWLDRRVTTAHTEGPGATPAPTPAATTAAPGPDDPVLDPNLTRIGADTAWEAGHTGEGATVAVLDTGVDADHPDLAGEVTVEENFSESDTVDDRHGHGTHVAATAAGTGDGADGARRGVAPDAELLNGKVLDDDGSGWESDLIAGMEWAAPRADVVNMSVGAYVFDPMDDPLARALDRLSEEHDTLFVVAAGNSGPLGGTVDTPGIAGEALTVGAVDLDDQLAEFSGRGPLPQTFGMKPELVAPGVDVVAARAEGTGLGDPVDGLYTTLSGTSMATPHVAGAAAVLAGQHPDWGRDELRNTLVGSADAVDEDGYEAGNGRLDIGDGVEAQLISDRGVVQASLPFPRTDTHDETVTWTNTSDETMTVELATELAVRGGEPVDGAEVEPSELTVDPGDTASATVGIDGPGLDDGLHSGAVVARVQTSGDGSDGPATVRTPLALHAEAEQVELTIEAVPPAEVAGDAVTGFVAVTNLDDYAVHNSLSTVNDDLTITVPVGRYSVLGDLAGPEDTAVVAQVGDPDVAISDDMTVTLDGTDTEPFDPTVDGVETAPPMAGSSGLITFPAQGTGGHGLILDSYFWYPNPPPRLTAMEADPEVFAADSIYRLQAPHLTVEVGDDTVEVTEASSEVQRPQLPVGEHTLPAVDVGDGEDLTDARGALAVVHLPSEVGDRVAVVTRAAEAEVAAVAFVDEERPLLTLQVSEPGPPLVAAAGDSATRLLDAARADEEVTITSAASPYVYDIVSEPTDRVIVDPVLDTSAQADLATLEETFHRDSDEVGPTTGDRRYPTSVSLTTLDSEGPLPEDRAAHVSPGVRWDSMVLGPGHLLWEGTPSPVESTAVSMNGGETYDAGETYEVTWLERPQWPGPVGLPEAEAISFCQPSPVTRTSGTLQIWLAPFQDAPDRFSCSDPTSATMTLERDGELVDSVDYYAAEFEVPEEPGSYTLTYEQEGASPYEHRSHTTWTFGSAAPDGPNEPVPMLTVDYDLPLDALNRPTHDEAVLSVRQVSGSEQSTVESLDVWTSVDGGETWDTARVQSEDDGTFEVTLPELEDDLEGASVSLRAEARDVAGNGIDQILYDAYTG